MCRTIKGGQKRIGWDDTTPAGMGKQIKQKNSGDASKGIEKLHTASAGQYGADNSIQTRLRVSKEGTQVSFQRGDHKNWTFTGSKKKKKTTRGHLRMEKLPKSKTRGWDTQVGGWGRRQDYYGVLTTKILSGDRFYIKSREGNQKKKTKKGGGGGGIKRRARRFSVLLR